MILRNNGDCKDSQRSCYDYDEVKQNSTSHVNEWLRDGVEVNLLFLFISALLRSTWHSGAFSSFINMNHVFIFFFILKSWLDHQLLVLFEKSCIRPLINYKDYFIHYSLRFKMMLFECEFNRNRLLIFLRQRIDKSWHEFAINLSLNTFLQFFLTENAKPFKELIHANSVFYEIEMLI